LIEAANELESLRIYGENLNAVLKCYSTRLESLREKIEGAARLHHLLALKLNEADVQMEMQKLAEKIGLSCLMQNNGSKSNGHNQQPQQQLSSSSSFRKAKMTITTTTITTSTPKKEIPCDSNQPLSVDSHMTMLLPAIEESPEKRLESHTTTTTIAKACQEEDIDDIDEEDDMTTTTTTMSKTLANDSGLGASTAAYDDSFASEMKEEEKLLRACSCESLVDDATMNACDNISQHEHDDADLDDYDTSENITSVSIDEPSKSESTNHMGPLQANAHLYCHASNLQLDLDDSIIDQKTQK
jgi:hypothetical protein